MLVTKQQLKTEFVRMRAGMAMALYFAVVSVFGLSLVSGGMVYATGSSDARGRSDSSKHEKREKNEKHENYKKGVHDREDSKRESEQKSHSDSQPRLKDWVCKYVTKPGGEERLKTGNDGLVWVDTHATEGTWFADGQHKSYVLKADATHDARPSVSTCPGGQVSDDDDDKDHDTQKPPRDSQPRLKDWVCKYTRTPGDEERLKRGNDGLVWVDTHATEGTWFNDKHTKSYVLKADAPRDPRPSASACPGVEEPEDDKVTAVTPTVSVVCGPDNDTVSLPSVAYVTYEQTGWTAGKNVVTATTADGYHFEGSNDKTMSWTFTDTNTSCGNVLGDTDDTPGKGGGTPQVLADTGAPVNTVSLVSLVLLAATAGVIALDVRRTRRLQAIEAVAL